MQTKVHNMQKIVVRKKCDVLYTSLTDISSSFLESSKLASSSFNKTVSFCKLEFFSPASYVEKEWK